MNNFFRAIIAGYGAKKLGGGCFGTIVVFLLIWVALGQCSFSAREVPPPETYPAKYRVWLPTGLCEVTCSDLHLTFDAAERHHASIPYAAHNGAALSNPPIMHGGLFTAAYLVMS